MIINQLWRRTKEKNTDVKSVRQGMFLSHWISLMVDLVALFISAQNVAKSAYVSFLIEKFREKPLHQSQMIGESVLWCRCA